MPTNLSEFRQHIAPYVQKCPDILIDKAVLDSYVEFARKSKRIELDMTAITVVANDADYTITNPTGYQVLTIRTLLYAGTKRLQAISEDQLDLNWNDLRCSCCVSNAEAEDNWRVSTAEQPTLFYQPTPNTLRLVAIPTVGLTDGLTGKLVVYPAQTATEIDDAIYNEFYEAIAAGAKHRLMMIPRQAWTDMKAAGFHRAEFEMGVGDAKTNVRKGHANDNAATLRTTVWA